MWHWSINDGKFDTNMLMLEQHLKKSGGILPVNKSGKSAEDVAEKKLCDFIKNSIVKPLQKNKLEDSKQIKITKFSNKYNIEFSTIGKQKDSWHEHYNQCLKLVQEEKRFPLNSKDDEKQLYYWLAEQNKKRKPVSDERLALLEKLNLPTRRWNQQGVKGALMEKNDEKICILEKHFNDNSIYSEKTIDLHIKTIREYVKSKNSPITQTQLDRLAKIGHGHWFDENIAKQQVIDKNTGLINELERYKLTNKTLPPYKLPALRSIQSFLDKGRVLEASQILRLKVIGLERLFVKKVKPIKEKKAEKKVEKKEESEEDEDEEDEEL
jgi:hypothetical protein